MRTVEAVPDERQTLAGVRQLREELKTHGWDEDLVRELVHGIDPDHPTLF